jgi:hypothetical protein
MAQSELALHVVIAIVFALFMGLDFGNRRPQTADKVDGA